MSNILKIKDIIEILKNKDLLKESHNIKDDLNVTGIQTDSRLIKDHEAFICIKGLESDGHNYFKQVIVNGCHLLICEKILDTGTAQVIVNDSRAAAAWLAKEFYEIDDKKMKLVGFTGTNGKTTTAYLAWQISQSCDIKSGYIGTIGCFYNDEKIATKLTTPDILDMMQILAKMQKSGVRVVFMEASSHALSLKRLRSLNFTTAVFLNLSQDHLDFHKDMTAYAKSKFSLFDQLLPNGYALINTEDEWGLMLWDRVNGKKLSIGFTNTDIRFTINKLDVLSSLFTLSYFNEKIEISSPLSGDFNVKNLTCAIATVKQTFPEISLTTINTKIGQLTSAPGRLERVISNQNKNIYIDYAHTPDAIAKVTMALRPFVKGRLITIIGAGGNRDKGKRPEMLKAALKYSDIVIITTDNPRDEEPVQIIKDIVSKATPNQAIWIKEDRETAIEDAISITNSDDVLLITGKGHETYQEVKGVRHHFDDHEKVTIISQKQKQAVHEINFDRIMIEFICNGAISGTTNQTLKTITTDTRNIENGSLFIPLIGERFDGHDFINNVLLDSSSITLSNKDYNIINNRVINVDNTLESLGKIARSYRLLLGTKIVGITGSTGKTSVKEYLAHILSFKAKTGKTSANENNYIGTAKTLLSLSPKDKFAVVELGTNHFGEIDWLTSISLPDLAIITNIGASHLEFLQDIDGVFNEKKAIFEHGAKVCLYPGDDDHFKELSGISFGFKEINDYQIKELAASEIGFCFRISNERYHLPLFAKFQVVNACIAIAASLELGLSIIEIKHGLSNLPELPMRLQRIKRGDGLVIADCYNANPQSMKSALEFWQQYQPDKPHLAILGSMLELGHNSQIFHHEIGELLKNKPEYTVISIGEEALAYGAEKHFENVDYLLKANELENIDDRAIILIKGSHSVHLEKILRRIT